MKVIRVAVIDDHAVVRMGLKYALSVFKDIQFAGEHPDGEGAAAFAAEHGKQPIVGNALPQISEAVLRSQA